VVLDEVLTNILKYGYTDDHGHEISVQLGIEGGALVGRIEDDGRPFDPLPSPTSRRRCAAAASAGSASISCATS